MKTPKLKNTLGKLKSKPTFYADRRSSEILSDILTNYTKPKIKFSELLAMLHEVSFAFVLIIVGILGGISPPGLTLITGLLPLYIGFQMVMGRESLSIPKWLGEKEISISTLNTLFGKAVPILQKIEGLMKVRFIYFNSKMGEKIIGIITIACSLSIIIPLPLTNFMPGMAVAMMGLGYLGKDGLVVLISMIVGILSSLLGYTIGAFFLIFGSEIATKFVDYISG